MQPKNIVLLGFVNKAVEYLDKHIDDDKSDYKLNKLKNIDLVSLEEELSKNLEFSLGSYQSTMTSLLKAGNEAFDDFLDAHAEKTNLLGDLGTIFDNGSLDSKRDEKQELEDLLSFYNLDVDDEIIQEESIEEDIQEIDTDDKTFEQVINEEDIQSKEKDIEEVTNKILDKILTNNPLLKALMDAATAKETEIESQETTQSEETEAYQIEENIEVETDELLQGESLLNEENINSNSEGVLEDLIDNSEVDEEEIKIDEANAVDEIEDEFLKQIVKAADENKNINNSEFDELYESSNNDEIDSIFSEIIDHENDVEIEQPEIEEVVEEISTEIEPEQVDEPTSEQQVEEIEEPVEELAGEPTKEIVEEPVVETSISDDDTILTDVLEDEIPVEEEYVDAKVDTELELKTITNYVPETLESLVSEIKEEIEPEDIVRPAEESTAQTYVSSLIDDLKKQMLEEEKVKVQEDEQRQAIYEEIHKSYPYLSSAFVKSVYDLKNSINDEYADGMKIILLSRILFEDVDELRQFAEVVMNHGYQINVDEKQMIVDCIKQLTNSRGKIIALIFDIANQAAALNGVYEGYRVIVDEV
ncbi:MAG: hypothetical protein Q4E33_02885 [Erysipelotrichaceae bacterium]|nr:hypothetical protein [Erysipelotrichaceae bacterium]